MEDLVHGKFAAATSSYYVIYKFKKFPPYHKKEISPFIK